MYTSTNYKYGQNVYEVPVRNIKLKKLQESIQQCFVFPDDTLHKFEVNVDEIVSQARKGFLKKSTVDITPLRQKYFFGERYTYGSQNVETGKGSERLYPKESVDPIPTWITTYIINPLIEASVLPENFVNSVVINDYLPGGCIVSHIDPPHIFDRPIVSLSLFSDSILSFGCKFQYKPLRCSKPLFQLEMPRGVITSLSGFAANEITHCVRPEDTTQRRAVIMLRRVHTWAPRLPQNNPIDISRKLLDADAALELTVDEFKKFHQNILRWQNEGSSIGKIKKSHYKKRESGIRYKSPFYTMS